MASRRGNGEGGARKRLDGRWEATVEIKSPNGGKRGRKYFYGRSKSEVLAKATKFRENQEGIGAVSSERMTMSQLLVEFLASKDGRVKDTTYLHYKGTVERYLIPHIGRVRLAALTAVRIDNLHNDLTAQGLSPRTCRHVQRVLHSALEMAVKRRYIGRNEASLATPPRCSAEPPAYLTLDELRSVLKAAKGDALEALYVLAITTGMRQGEILGLRWEAVSMDSGQLRVTHTLSKDRDFKLLLTEPKSIRSRRTIGLTPGAIEALSMHRARQDEKTDSFGQWNPDGLVFPTATGTYLNPSNLLNRHYYPLLRKAGVRRVTFHQLRHSYATQAVAGSIPVAVVSQLLGHTDVATTMRYYAHATPENVADAPAQFSRLLEAS